MKKLIYFICCPLLFLLACQTHKYQLVKEPVPKFENQGEQEDYWDKKFFDDNYKKEIFKRYIGDIQTDGDTIRYSNDMISLGDHSALRLIFTSGLIYPKLFNYYKLSVGNVEEKSPINHSVKIKRFQLWAFLPKMANPTVYVFELTNKRATKDTPISEFIKGAQLTFFKEGWIIV
ncbi:hypothetical protein [Mucilaginibacter sp.]